MKRIISCDWGTTTLRLQLIDANAMTVLAEAISLQGISATFDLWKRSGEAENDRLFFYQSVLAGQIKRLGQQLNASLQGDPLIVSGMASSNIGMMELPYKQMPFSLDGHDLEIKLIPSTDQFRHNIVLISGAKTKDDVMRGEETQLIGCAGANAESGRIFIFPGTHSKHVSVKDDKAWDVKTYMTGEFFELLARKSILANDIKDDGDLFERHNLIAFKKGVSDSIHSNLLHSSFSIRANSLLGRSSGQENRFYLSGLLIGTELKELVTLQIPLTITGNKLQLELYTAALNELGVKQHDTFDASRAILHAHCRIHDLYQFQLANRPGV